MHACTCTLAHTYTLRKEGKKKEINGEITTSENIRLFQKTRQTSYKARAPDEPHALTFGDGSALSCCGSSFPFSLDCDMWDGLPSMKVM